MAAARAHALALALALLAVAAAPAAPAAPPPNILYLVADDMRPQLGAFGQAMMHTPNLDRLARGALAFDTAYTQFAYCAPSRNSFMTGRRPERTRCLNFLTDFRRQHGSGWVAMPQFFKNAGFFTSASGKVFHDGMDDPASWSFPSNQTAWLAGNGIPPIEGDVCDVYGNYCAITNRSVIPYSDEDLVLAEGLARMQRAHDSGKPWFVGIGVHRPHWPSRLPAGFLGPELYPSGVEPPKHPLGIPLAPFMSGAYQDGEPGGGGGRRATRSQRRRFLLSRCAHPLLPARPRRQATSRTRASAALTVSRRQRTQSNTDAGTTPRASTPTTCWARRSTSWMS